MGGTGGTASTGRDRTQGVGNFLQGGGTSGSTVWVGDVGPFSINGKEGREVTHRVPATDHGEYIKVIRIRDMGDAEGGRRTRGSRNPGGEGLHRETAGNHGAVGGATSLI